MLTGQQLAALLKRIAESPGLSAERLARDYGIPSPTVHGWIRHRQQSRKNMDLIAKVVQICFDHSEFAADFIKKSPIEVAKELAEKAKAGNFDPGVEHVAQKRSHTRRK